MTLQTRRSAALCSDDSDVLEKAIREGIPFQLNMADGRQYEVCGEHRIALGARREVVMDHRDLPHVLPLVTMTRVSYLPTGDDATKP